MPTATKRSDRGFDQHGDNHQHKTDFEGKAFANQGDQHGEQGQG